MCAEAYMWIRISADWYEGVITWMYNSIRGKTQPPLKSLVPAKNCLSGAHTWTHVTQEQMLFIGQWKIIILGSVRRNYISQNCPSWPSSINYIHAACYLLCPPSTRVCRGESSCSFSTLSHKQSLWLSDSNSISVGRLLHGCPTSLFLTVIGEWYFRGTGSCHTKTVYRQLPLRGFCVLRRTKKLALLCCHMLIHHY